MSNKTPRTSIANADFWIQEGDLHAVNTEDGVGHYPLSWVGFTLEDGRSFIYPSHFLASMVDAGDYDVLVSSKSKCDELISEVKKLGSVDLGKWNEYKPEARNLEAEWAADYQQEMMEQGRYR
ncbi:hypothetical protein OTK49_21535 [Vibrio coralliirubri]|uniref:hypothetical protein n=1 Tax=Vibrio coralliirubri TaxID=1516159 RepID=UPI0022846645|nr:hypothetical protein [Vibrio coralliirubri]MCY9865105.1 hypothetical protein [Vibrio coralliirubri]